MQVCQFIALHPSGATGAKSNAKVYVLQTSQEAYTASLGLLWETQFTCVYLRVVYVTGGLASVLSDSNLNQCITSQLVAMPVTS